MDNTTTQKMLLQAISELQSKNKGQSLDNIRRFCEENDQCDNSKTDWLLTSCANESILQKVVSNGKDSYWVVTRNIKNTHLDDTEVSPSDEHIIPAAESNYVPPLSSIDILYEEFTNIKTFVCQEVNFIKQELSDVNQSTNKSNTWNCNHETCHKNALDDKVALLETNNTSSNSDKVKTIKHLSENHKQKVQ